MSLSMRFTSQCGRASRDLFKHSTNETRHVGVFLNVLIHPDDHQQSLEHKTGGVWGGLSHQTGQMFLNTDVDSRRRPESWRTRRPAAGWQGEGLIHGGGRMVLHLWGSAAKTQRPSFTRCSE